MRAGLPQLDGLLVELPPAAVGVGGDPLSHGLDAVLAVWVEEDYYGVPLGVVQGVHRLGRDVQQGVLFLRGVGGGQTERAVFVFLRTHEAISPHANAFICWAPHGVWYDR